jgi:hypothetical protein
MAFSHIQVPFVQSSNLLGVVHRERVHRGASLSERREKPWRRIWARRRPIQQARHGSPDELVQSMTRQNLHLST